MVRFSIRENEIRYKVLLYSDNPGMINALNNKLNNENIGMEIKHLKSGNFQSKTKEVKKNHYLKIIYDLSLSDIDSRRVISETNTLADNIIFIVKTKKISRFGINSLKNKVVLIDKTDKDTSARVAKFVSENLIDNKSEIINFSKEKNIKFKINKRILIITAFAAVLTLPYLMTFCLFINTLFINLPLFETLDLNTEKSFLLLDAGIKKKISGLCYYYGSLSLIGPLYGNMAEYSQEVYNESQYRLSIISKIKDLNSFITGLLSDGLIGSGRKTESGTTGSILKSGFIKDKNKLTSLTEAEKETENANKLYEFLVKYRDSDESKYFIIATLNKSILSPTGGRPEEIILYSVREGRCEIINSISDKDLQSKFKGRVDGNKLFQDVSEPYLQNILMDKEDIFELYSKMIKDVYNLDISGIITVEESEKDKIDGIKKTTADDSLSLRDSLIFYKRLNVLIENNNISFYFPGNDGNVVDNNIFRDYKTDPKDKCFGNDLTFMEVADNAGVFQSGEVILNGSISDDLLSLDIYYTNQNRATGYSFMIKAPGGWKMSPLNSRDFNQKKIRSNNNIYLSTEFPAKPVDAKIIHYDVPLNNCDSGFGLFLEKQPGNDFLKLRYNIISSTPLYLYIDSTLTGRGNKFYNTGLLNINKNIKVEFVK